MLPGDFNASSPFTVPCNIGSNEEIKTNALIDTGATGYAFIDEKLAHVICNRWNMKSHQLNAPKPVIGYDGRIGRTITHAIYPTMTVQGHRELSAPMLITPLGQHDVILGRSWNC